MITIENLSFCFDDLKEEEITKAFESNSDYLVFQLHSFNTGSYSSLLCEDYDEFTRDVVLADGNIYCDKDEFLMLFKESDSVNPFLIELL